IAIDYSMLVVFRYREELDHGDAEHALERTMATAGRATLFSGATVAIGLALLVFMPLPFMRSMGVGGLLVPLVSIAASATLLLAHTLGPGALAPHPIVVDTGRPGGAWSAPVEAAQRRLAVQLRGDKQVEPRTIGAPVLLVKAPGTPPAAALAQARQANLVDPTGRYLQMRVAGHTDAGFPPAEALVHRIRERYVPAARFGQAQVFLTGAPAFGVDFKHKAYSAFPWLIAAVLIISY